ncbi:DUF4811 domain-containing protein [Weissella viridescens]|uniref:DUF4811 domain-containing protein n=1 Tax=Weissella viridescens TaxID=1629 RepID=A0A3P2RB00_WEIVI|nr:DUF4811 domain-containing protein [Weissella viridescens]RRG17919.1 DUF4811 domain-containing protein [Weissella viridescens]
MIIVLLLLFVVLTFVSWIYIKPVTLRVIAGTISLVLLMLSVWAMTVNFTDHFGMKKVTTTKTTQIYTAGDTSSPANMLLAQEIGTKSNNYVMVYRDKASDKKPAVHNKPDTKHIVEAVKKTATYQTTKGSQATAKTTTTRWRFKNDFYKMMFGVSDQQNQLIKQHTLVRVPSKTWVVMTPSQAKSLGAKQKQMPMQAQQAQQMQMKQAVQAKMMAYMQAHPTATSAQQKAQANAYAAEIATSALKQQDSK